LLAEHVSGRRALDSGCGTGRTSRLLHQLGFAVTGVDISTEMVEKARVRDPGGDYRVIADGDFSALPAGGYDLVLASFTFDNIPGRRRRLGLFQGLRRLLAPAGRLVLIASTPEIYRHEWATFTTRDFPANHEARCGEVVRIVFRDRADDRPVQDILWPDPDYRALFTEAGLVCLRDQRPLARGDEGVPWVSETQVPPWALYVLERTQG
jgi:SAM-dependent methyltransferase